MPIAALAHLWDGRPPATPELVGRAPVLREKPKRAARYVPPPARNRADLECPIVGCVPPQRDLRHPQGLAGHMLRVHGIGPDYDAIPAKDAPKNLWCRIVGCPYPGPFDSEAGRSGHRRRTHGIAAVTQPRRRPIGGVHPCPHGCDVEPYLTPGGLSAHLRTDHGYISERGGAAARRRSSAQKPMAPKDPLPPPITGEPAYRPRHHRGIDRDVRERLRRRVLYALNVSWSREWDASPTALRNALLDIIVQNFQPPQKKPVRHLPIP